MIHAEVGDVQRFPTPGHLASSAGLVPSVENSARRVRYGQITRRGSPWLRWALVDAATHGTRRTDRIGRWGRGLAVRKGADEGADRRAVSSNGVMTTWSICE